MIEMSLCKQPSNEGVIRSIANPEPCSKEAAPWILLATIIGSSMAFIDGTVVNVALPALQSDLNATLVDVQWVVEGYAVLLAALIIVGGSLGDLYGRRRVFAIGIVIFAIASAGCGLAQNVQYLIAARAAQGIGGALMVPGSLAIIGAYFDDSERGRAIGTWSAFSAMTTALGPVLGGWLIENASWRWIFFINLPLALIVLVVLYWRVPESRGREGEGGLDFLGAALVTISLGAIIFGLIESANLTLSHPLVLGSLVTGIAAFVAFILTEIHGKAPMMPLSLFRSRTFGGANLVTVLLYAPLSCVLFFIPFDLIYVQGYSATATGSAFLPIIIIIFLLSRWSGGLVDRYGPRPPLVIGPTIASAGYVLFAIPGIGGAYWTTFFPAMVVLGLGMAISIAPVTAAVMKSVETHRMGIASGINNAISRVAGVMAIALLGIVIFASFNSRLDTLLADIQLPMDIRQMVDDQRIRLAAAEAPPAIDETTKLVVERAIDESFVYGLRVVMMIAAALALTSAVVAWLTLKGTKPETGPKRPLSDGMS